MDKVDIWLNAVIPSHTSGEIMKGTEAVPTQPVWQPFSGAAPCKRGFPVTQNSTNFKNSSVLGFKPRHTPRGSPSESLRCTSVSIQDFAVMRARRAFLKEAEIFKMLQLQEKKKKYSKIQKLIVYYVATVGGDVFQTI